FSPLPRAPRSPLFPYTTLFRSQLEPSKCQTELPDLGSKLMREAQPSGRRTPNRARLSNRRPLPGSAICASAGKPATTQEWLRGRSEEHTSELQSRFDLVCRLLL